MSAEQHKHNTNEQLSPSEIDHTKHETYMGPVNNSEKHPDNKDSKNDIESLRKTAEHHAQSHETHKLNHNAQPSHEHTHHYLTKRVKKDVYKHTLSDVQTHLSPVEKRISSLIHNDIVESISEVGSKTIARPSGVLGGAILMVFGGLIVLLFAKRYGFEIPLSVYLFLYLIGFVLFVAVELISSPIKRLSKRNR